MDLNSLISEVLDMVRKTQTNGRWVGANWMTGRQVDEEEKRKAELEKLAKTQEGSLQLQSSKNLNDLAVERQKGLNQISHQETANAGALAVGKESNIGAEARQRLIGKSASDVATINAGAHTRSAELTSGAQVRSAELTSDAHRYAADRTMDAQQGRTNDPDKLLAEIVKSNPLMKTDEMIELRKRLKAQNQGQSPVKGDSSAFMKTDSASPSISEPVTLPTPRSVTSYNSRGPSSVRGSLIEPLTPVEDPILAENLRRGDEARRLRNDAATSFWRPIKDKFTYEPNSPNRRFGY